MLNQLKNTRLLRYGLAAGAIALLAVGLVVVVQDTASAVSCLAQTDPAPAAPRISAGPFAPSASADALVIPAARYGLPTLRDPGYDRDGVRLTQGASVSFTIAVPADGAYSVTFDAAVPAETTRAEGRLTLDGSPAIDRVIFPTYYRDQADAFPKDRYGNDALIPQARDPRWSSVTVRDVNVSLPHPVTLALTAGDHTLTLTLTAGTLLLGEARLAPFAPPPDHADYLAAHAAAPDVTDFSLTLEAERPSYKNDTSVRPTASRGLSVTPYDTYCLLLNTLGGETWVRSGTGAYYEFIAPRDGLYALSLRAMQGTRSGFTVFRRITVNGEVPFAQFNAVPFGHSPDWVTVTLPYRVFLRAGVNVIGIEATSAPYASAIATIQGALTDINALALEIRRLTGNQRDPFREWDMASYIPDLAARLNGIADDLVADQASLTAYNVAGASPESLTYQIAIDNLRFLAADPDRVPATLSRFSSGSGSAAGLLGALLPLLQNGPLAIDRLVIHAPGTPPEFPAPPPATVLLEDARRFLYSFRPDPLQVVGADAGEIEVWVNRARQYVGLLQLMADTTFTPQTGIRVKFSIMPDENKLVLANAAGIQPDVALGVSTAIPYELAIRGALYDLRRFPDFGAAIQDISPGALLGYIIDDSVYALPETQDFWVTFYRHDILDSLGIPVPNTWDEVIAILPELQRSGMNYSVPLSIGAGQRNYIFTAPYLFNYNAPLYADDGFATGLESEEAVQAIRFMADSFTLYGIPLTAASFYDSFRYGTLPIGIANAEIYSKLSFAAPEIGGRWSIALHPATVSADGTARRYATGSAQTSVMFAATDQPDQAWEFLRWWTSTETQIAFQEELILNFGREFLWFSANNAAFAQLDIPEDHRAVILEQWQWIQEPVRLPGSYMQERELSNIWNRIVFDGVNPRVAIDRSVTLINREITRKMEEFGYIQDGARVRAFTIPTIETVRGWMDDGDGR